MSTKSTASSPTLESRTLFGTHTEIIIMHKGVAYRLRQTSNDKLILTK